MSKRNARVQDAEAYLLHSSAWRETSLLIQTFARDYGVVSLAARGAKRPYSVLRPVLSAFQPLAISWSGAGEVKTLTRAECVGVRRLGGRAYMSAWYMNELLLRLLPREDPHPVLFDAYNAALERLSSLQPAASALRRFEWTLLQETGYGTEVAAPDFDDVSTEPQLRRQLRQRLDELLGRPLQTRKVLMELQRY
jgi:DNA repair protein RecO (recombination protein O)